MTGFHNYSGYGSNTVAYMFKRHAGFDTVNYMGNGSSRTITHSMNQVPEMIVCKKVENTGGWQVYHKGAGNTKYMYWNQDYQAQTSSAVWGNTTPTSFPALTGANAPLGRADMSAVGKKKVLGVDTTTISTVYGDIYVVRNVHLDGTNVALLGVNMKHCAYRPLVGNGINRDTSIYVGVQTLENSGVDRRVDQILTEAGMEFSMPEAHAIWKTS